MPNGSEQGENQMGTTTRAIRNISRRKTRALLVIIALGFSMAIMVAVPAGISSTQESTQRVTQALSDQIQATSESVNLTMTQLDVTIPSSLSGFGFGDFNFTPGSFGGGNGGPNFPPGNFTPGQFGGGGRIPGQFGAGDFSSQSSTPMNESLYSDISSIDGVAAVSPILVASEGYNTTVSTNFGSFTRFVANYTIEGVTLTNVVNDYPILPTNITAGRNLEAGESGVTLLSENNSAYFGVNVGDTVTILGKSFLVVGIHGSSSSSSSSSDRLVLYMNLSDAQAITNNTGMITDLRVFADSVDNVDSISSTITSLHSELNVQTAQETLTQIQNMQTQSEEELLNAQNTLNQTQTTAFTEIVVAVAATSLIVLFVMLYTVRERTKEIGTLKAIGFSNGTVMRQFMLEGILLSVLAGVVGIAIGVVAAPSLVSLLQLTPIASSVGFGARAFGGDGVSSVTSAVSISPEIVLIAFGVSVLLGALGSLYPAWRAARTRPAEAMRYE
jgi:ABC-type lipoprotein release transport system permease subunit